MHASLLSLEQAVTALLARIEGPLRIATPLGLGKPNRLVNALYDEMTKPAGEPLAAGLDSTVHSHLIAFAAEEARVTGKTVELDEFERRLTTRA